VLTRTRAPVAGPPTGRRGRAALAAIAPTARVAHLGAAALTVGLGAIPVVVTVLRGDPSLSAPFLLACLLGGATLGWAIEDPAADLLAAMPVSTATRTTLRLLSVAVVAATGIALTMLVATIRPGLPPDRGDRVAEAAAAAALAVTVGLVAARRGERGTGPIGVTAGVLGTGLVAALAYRWPSQLPTFGPGPIHDRWWLLTALALAVAAHAGRDPGR